MKKIIILFALIISFSFLGLYQAGAEGAIKVTVSEDLSQVIEGDCTPKTGQAPATGGPPAPTGYYECPVEKGFGSVQGLLGNMIKYMTFLIGLVGVLFVVINGIMYSIGGEDKSGAKDRIIKSVGGLLLLLLSGVILNAIAPWIYTAG